MTTRGNSNVQSHDQEESKLNSTTIGNSDTHTLPNNKTRKATGLKSLLLNC